MAAPPEVHHMQADLPHMRVVPLRVRLALLPRNALPRRQHRTPPPAAMQSASAIFASITMRHRPHEP
jgi:hypothetical protein